MPKIEDMLLRTYAFHYHVDDKVFYKADHEFRDDLDALDTARSLAQHFGIKVLCGERFVARVKKDDAALTVHDTHSN